MTFHVVHFFHLKLDRLLVHEESGLITQALLRLHDCTVAPTLADGIQEIFMHILIQAKSPCVLADCLQP